MDWLYSDSDPLWETLAGCLLIFFAVIAITRVVGLRSFAKFTTFDFAFTVAVGSIISATLTSSTSIAQGSVAIAGLLLLTAIIAFLQRKSDVFKSAISNAPLLLMDGEEVLEDNLTAARVSYDQLMAKLREANVISFSQVKYVVLESTGDISVLHTAEKQTDEVEDRILAGVRKKP